MTNYSEPVLDSAYCHGDGHATESMNCPNQLVFSNSSPGFNNISYSDDVSTCVHLDFPTTNQYYNKVMDGYSEQLSYASNSIDTQTYDSPYVEMTQLCSSNSQAGNYDMLNNCSYSFGSIPNIGHNHINNMNYNISSHESHVDADPDHFNPHQYITTDQRSTTALSSNTMQNGSIPETNECQTLPINLDEAKKSSLILTKTSIGIQCEVGPETLQALLEEESLKDDQVDIETCEFCNVLFLASMSALYFHAGLSEGTSDSQSDERLVQKFPCKVENCNKAYIHRKDVIRHMRIRHGITPQKLEAIVVETPEKPHVCDVSSCKRSYFHLKDLKRHQRLCHQVQLSSCNNTTHTDDNSTPFTDNTQMRYPCDFSGCLRSYIHKKDLVRHKRLYHKDVSSKPSIPVPVKYTDSDLKRIRQRVKQEIDTKEHKMRLDSTSSTTSAANSHEEYCSDTFVNGSQCDETDYTIILSSQDVKGNSEVCTTPISGDVASILGALEQHGKELYKD